MAQPSSPPQGAGALTRDGVKIHLFSCRLCPLLVGEHPDTWAGESLCECLLMSGAKKGAKQMNGLITSNN